MDNRVTVVRHPHVQLLRVNIFRRHVNNKDKNISYLWNKKRTHIMLSPPHLNFPGIFPATICWRWESDISMRYLVFSVFYLWPAPRPYITAPAPLTSARGRRGCGSIFLFLSLLRRDAARHPDPELRLSSARVTPHVTSRVTLSRSGGPQASSWDICRLKATSEVWSTRLAESSHITPSANLELRFYVKNIHDARH